MKSFNKLLVSVLCLMLLLALCACGSSDAKDIENTVGEGENVIEKDTDYLSNFLSAMKDANFDVYDVSHQYDEEGIISAGRAEKADDGISVYLYEMKSPEHAEEKFSALKENFDPESLEEVSEHITTAAMNNVRYLIWTDGRCVYMELAPEKFTLDEMASFVRMELGSNAEG